MRAEAAARFTGDIASSIGVQILREVDLRSATAVGWEGESWAGRRAPTSEEGAAIVSRGGGEPPVCWRRSAPRSRTQEVFDYNKMDVSALSNFDSGILSSETNRLSRVISFEPPSPALEYQD